jgi:phosphoglucosamine mutase
LKNVRFAGSSPLRSRRIRHAIAAAEAALNGSGRLVVRESGTEPLIRVMAEGEDEALIARIVDELCGTVAAAASLREEAD